jgi:hypothetical protein
MVVIAPAGLRTSGITFDEKQPCYGYRKPQQPEQNLNITTVSKAPQYHHIRAVPSASCRSGLPEYGRELKKK